MKLKGKQLADNTITQDKMNVTTDTVIDNDDVTTKEFVDNAITDSIGEITYSTTNLNMSASATAPTGAKLGCAYPIASKPNSAVSVLVNNLEVNIGGTEEPYDGFFSPDGVIVRAPGTEQLGDFLYWNTDIVEFQLETDDEIDFVYLTLV